MSARFQAVFGARNAWAYMPTQPNQIMFYKNKKRALLSGNGAFFVGGGFQAAYAAKNRLYPPRSLPSSATSISKARLAKSSATGSAWGWSASMKSLR